MNKLMTLKKQSLFFLILLIILPIFKANAQLTSIRISPAIIERNLNPGEVFSTSLSITNQESVTQQYYLTKRNIRASSFGDELLYTEEETEFELSSWMKIPREPLVLKSGETKEISFNIVVPQNASPGSHFGAIFASLKPPEVEDKNLSVSTVGYLVGMIVSIRIPGAIVEDAQIREFSTDRNIYNKPKVIFNAVTENLGNVIIKPRGFVDIIDSFGKKITTLDINKSKLSVFPKSRRNLVSTWEGEGLVFGRYQAALNLVYGEDSKRTLISSTSFWVLPLKIILPILGIVMATLFFISIFIKMHIKKRMRELSRSLDGQSGSRVVLGRAGTVLRKDSSLARLPSLALILLIFIMLLLIILFLFLA